MSCSKLPSNSQKLMLYALRGIIHGVVLENLENIFKHLKITLPTNLMHFQNSGQIFFFFNTEYTKKISWFSNTSIILHWQRLSSSGYVFFASLPPYVASAVITAINVLEENPHLITKLEKNIATLRKGLSDVQGLEIVSDPKSPIVFLKLKNSTGSLKGDLQVLDDIAERVLAGVEEVSFSLKVMVNKQKTKVLAIC